MKTQHNFTLADFTWAREYWSGLSFAHLFLYWKHYTTGKGAGSYMQVYADTSFCDYVVLSASQSHYERVNDI